MSLSPNEKSDLGILFRPLVTQISRWDKLKGWVELMKSFCHLKENSKKYATSPEHLEYIQQSRLILGGPDPAYIADDPEGLGVFGELRDFYIRLPEIFQDDIAILELPMENIDENALIVNALQRMSTVVVQNSIQEGFGLTCTEAMYKGIPVLGTSACGLRQQLRDGEDGLMVQNPKNIYEIADLLGKMLESKEKRKYWSMNARKRVIDKFLIFSLIESWIKTIKKVV
jgi:trehalose synthase